MTIPKVSQLVARAVELATDAFDDDVAVTELRGLAQGDGPALERAMQVSLAQPISLVIRHRAIELLARVRYEDPSLPREMP
jgi:hypothetical protein